MIVFNTTMKVGTGIHIAWLQWQKEQHIPEIMDSGLFTDYKFFRLLEQDEQDGITYVLQFYCSGYDDYKKYRDEFHGMFEQIAFIKWGNRVISFHTVMEDVH